MKAYICNACGKHGEPNKYDLAPDGWVHFNYTEDACSRACAVVLINKRFDDQELRERQAREAEAAKIASMQVAAVDSGVDSEIPF